MNIILAGVTQLVESLPSKQVVASSSLVSRSTGAKDRLMTTCMGRGEIDSGKAGLNDLYLITYFLNDSTCASSRAHL